MFWILSNHMKKVYNPETRQIEIIDESKFPDWMERFWHLSGVPFHNKEITVVYKDAPLSDLSTEKLQEKYEQMYGKPAPTAYKSRRERLINKLT